jgi:hypothetical protein
MTLDDLLKIDFTGKDILILGKPSAGKTWLSEVFGGMYKHHTVINTDDYIYIGGVRAIAAIIEDQSFTPPCIIEGMMGYDLLLEGAIKKSYSPDYVIEVEISAGKQREIYLAEREISKLQYQNQFYLKCQAILNFYLTLTASEPDIYKPDFITFNNHWNAIEVKDK